MKVLGVIPARAGSKRLFGKNTKELCGKPLIEYTLEVAKDCKYLDDIIVTTDDEDIKKLSREYGFEVIDRPKNLAGDKATMKDTIEHAIREKPHEIIVLLQPTSPLRTADDIYNCVGLYEEYTPTSVVTVMKMNLFSVFVPNGAVYVIHRNDIRKCPAESWHDDKSILVVMPRERSIDIDTQLDFDIAEMIINDNS